MDKPTFQRLLYSQAIFYITLIVCIALAPASLSANSGISYFGHHKITVIPFALGFLFSDYYLFRARQLLITKPDYKVLSVGLSVIIPCMLGIVLAPAIGDGLLDLAHRIFGSITFVTELALGFWLARFIQNDAWSWVLWLLQILGGVIAFIYLSPPTGYSIEGQLLFQLAFSGLLFHSLTSTELKR